MFTIVQWEQNYYDHFLNLKSSYSAITELIRLTFCQKSPSITFVKNKKQKKNYTIAEKNCIFSLIFVNILTTNLSSPETHTHKHI